MMLFEEVWSNILDLITEDTIVKTLKHGRNNKVTEVSTEGLRVNTSQHSVFIEKNQFELAWNRLIEKRELLQKEIDDLKWPSFITAIFSQLPYIISSSDPVKITLLNNGNNENIEIPEIPESFKDHILSNLKRIQAELNKTHVEEDRFKRSKSLVNNLKWLYGFQCQLCDRKKEFIPPIPTANGNNYVEVHHIIGFEQADSNNILILY